MSKVTSINGDQAEPPATLVESNTSDTLDNVSSVLAVIDQSQREHDEALDEKATYGRGLLIELCRTALEHEQRRLAQ